MIKLLLTLRAEPDDVAHPGMHSCIGCVFNTMTGDCPVELPCENVIYKIESEKEVEDDD